MLRNVCKSSYFIYINYDFIIFPLLTLSQKLSFLYIPETTSIRLFVVSVNLGGEFLPLIVLEQLCLIGGSAA